MLINAMRLIMDAPALNAGREAGEAGKEKTDNPYTNGERLWKDWNFGWQLGATKRAANQNRAAIADAPDVTPFDQGIRAAEAGSASSANPYHFGHPSHDEWRLGWSHRKAS